MWAVFLVAWWLLSVPVACLAVRLFRDDPRGAGNVAPALFPPIDQLDAGRSLTPRGGSQAAGVLFSDLIPEGDRP